MKQDRLSIFIFKFFIKSFVLSFLLFYIYRLFFPVESEKIKDLYKNRKFANQYITSQCNFNLPVEIYGFSFYPKKSFKYSIYDLGIVRLTRIHLIYQFCQPLMETEINALRKKGILILDELQNNSYLVSAPWDVLYDDNLVFGNLRWLGPILSDWKVDPTLLNYDFDSEKEVFVLIETYFDVDPDILAKVLRKYYDLAPVKTYYDKDLAGVTVYVNNGELLKDLASEDLIKYIKPVSFVKDLDLN